MKLTKFCVVMGKRKQKDNANTIRRKIRRLEKKLDRRRSRRYEGECQTTANVFNKICLPL